MTSGAAPMSASLVMGRKPVMPSSRARVLSSDGLDHRVGPGTRARDEVDAGAPPQMYRNAIDSGVRRVAARPPRRLSICCSHPGHELLARIRHARAQPRWTGCASGTPSSVCWEGSITTGMPESRSCCEHLAAVRCCRQPG